MELSYSVIPNVLEETKLLRAHSQEVGEYVKLDAHILDIFSSFIYSQ